MNPPPSPDALGDIARRLADLRDRMRRLSEELPPDAERDAIDRVLAELASAVENCTRVAMLGVEAGESRDGCGSDGRSAESGEVPQ